MSKAILVIPCSGIGKVYGTVGRDAALQVVEDLRPDKTATMCLSLLVMGDEEARMRVQGTQTVTIDGCALACVLLFPEDYSSAVRKGANSSGDFDSIASIAGAMSGALLGAEAIPKDWKKRVENRSQLLELASQFLAEREGGE